MGSSETGLILTVFLLWKGILNAVALLSPGDGYDTSAVILLRDAQYRSTPFQTMSLWDRATLKFLRWDALYFIKAARSGYDYEQEWAFSWAYSSFLSSIANLYTGPTVASFVWVSVFISNICHLLSVIVLYRLVKVMTSHRRNETVALIAALLHIVSPAGIFLSAPYTESSFSLFNFSGLLLYVQARETAKSNGSWTVTQDICLLGSGLSFAVATLIRSNGLLSGLVFLYDVGCAVPQALTFQLQQQEVRRLIVTCVAGCLIALGFISPQVLVYKDFCVAPSADAATRPWCNRLIPSVYSWVQSHYWNVGLFSYWTLSNLPLFLLAAPMLWLLFTSSVTVLRYSSWRYRPPGHSPQTVGPARFKAPDNFVSQFPQLALPELVLAVMASTSFHVQIINRLCSGYPTWYMVMAQWIVDQRVENRKHTTSGHLIRWIIMYSAIQAALFAAFLPPA